jgi:hypothetical protein
VLYDCNASLMLVFLRMSSPVGRSNGRTYPVFQHLTCRASLEFVRVSSVQITNFGNRVWVLLLTLTLWRRGIVTLVICGPQRRLF